MNGSKMRTKRINDMKYIPEYLEEITKLLKDIKKELASGNPKEKKSDTAGKAGRPKKGEIEMRNADNQ